MTWFGHCIVNVTTALRTLPPAGQLMLIRDLRDFLDRQDKKFIVANGREDLRQLLSNWP
jgi:hypothetical protein